MISFASYPPDGKSKPLTENIMLISPSGDEKQKEILDSIHYAKRIQKAIITSEHLFDKYLRRNKQQ